ncbi:MAG: phage tail protein, partial [Gammaproteobacteria bacterium]|nr:phage tail protein [Gammaproteobacteria bacterium]
FGAPSQGENAYLKAKTNAGLPIPAYRGIVSTVFEGCQLSSMNPYIKDLWARVTRTPYYLPAYDMASGANPAAIVYECITNTDWGMGMWPNTSIDSTSFSAAADKLKQEDFGLNLMWNQESSVGSFIQIIMDHIDGVLTVDPTTNKYALTLIRDDYVIANLLELNEGNVLELTEFERSAWSETVNEVQVVYNNAARDQEDAVVIQDLASIEGQGSIISKTMHFPGISTPEKALVLAQRELNATSVPLSKVTLKANREAWSLQPGGVFKLAWPKLGIVQTVFRVVEITTGSLDRGTINIVAIEDVFSMPTTSYTESEPAGWVAPDKAPISAAYLKVFEASYWEGYRSLREADFLNLDPDWAFGKVAAVRGNGLQKNCTLHVSTDGGTTYDGAGAGSFVPTALVSGTVLPNETTIPYDNDLGVSTVSLGTFAIIETGSEFEYVEVVGIDSINLTLTVNRGILDTVPHTLVDGDRILFTDGRAITDKTERLVTEVVNYKLLSVAGGGSQDLGDVSPYPYTFNNRPQRPYPPANVLINNVSFPVTDDGAINLVWSERNRLTQTAGYVGWFDATISPEAGVTYSLNIRDADTDAILKAVTGLAATTYSYTLAQEITDWGIIHTNIRIEIWSVRSGLDSMQRYDYTYRRVFAPVTQYDMVTEVIGLPTNEFNLV